MVGWLVDWLVGCVDVGWSQAGRSTATAVIALMPTDGMRGCNLAVLTTADASCRSGREDGEDEPGMRIKRLCDGRRMLDW